MKNEIILFIKGFIIGIGKIIPGVSGAMLAITLGIYEEALKSIHNIKSIFQNFKFLFLLALGVLLSIILGSNVITYFLQHYYFLTMLLFVGLIMGGIPSIYQKTRQKKFDKHTILWFIIPFGMVLLLSSLHTTGSSIILQPSVCGFLFLIIIGLLEAATMIIPGISGTAIMMMIGCYEPLLQIWGNILNVNLIGYHISVLLPFGIGVLLGIFLLAKLMNYLFQHHAINTYWAIMGFALSSIILLVLKTLQCTYSIPQLCGGFLLLVIGYQLAVKLDKLDTQ